MGMSHMSSSSEELTVGDRSRALFSLCEWALCIRATECDLLSSGGLDSLSLLGSCVLGMRGGIRALTHSLVWRLAESPLKEQAR
jgi:hypothetical protein